MTTEWWTTNAQQENEDMEATCAVCGEQKPLCNSVRIDGIQQPRLCLDCVSKLLRTGEAKTNDAYWARQMAQLGDKESLEALAARL